MLEPLVTHFFLKGIFFNASSESSWKLLQSLPEGGMEALFIHRTGFGSTEFIIWLQSTRGAVTGLCVLTLQDNFWQLPFVFLETEQHGKDKGVYIPIHQRLDQELKNSVHIRHNHLMAAASSYSSEQTWMEAHSFEMNGFPLPTHWAFQPKTK